MRRGRGENNVMKKLKTCALLALILTTGLYLTACSSVGGKNEIAVKPADSTATADAPTTSSAKVGINIQDSPARLAGGIKDFGIKYAVASDADASVARRYKVVGTPTVVFLDGQGVVQYFGNELPKDYAARLDALLAKA
jgi:hypothetical protein